jgi:hypothetical protein
VGQAQGIGGLGQSQSGECAELDELGRSGVYLRKCGENFVESQQVVAGWFGVQGIEVDAMMRFYSSDWEMRSRLIARNPDCSRGNLELRAERCQWCAFAQRQFQIGSIIGAQAVLPAERDRIGPRETSDHDTFAIS